MSHLIVYHWLAEYDNNEAIPQFNEDGSENPFSKVDTKRLRKFHWLPFNNSLALKVYQKNGLIVKPSKNIVYSLQLNEGDELIARRRNEIALTTMHLCLECGYIWTVKKEAKPNQIEPLTGNKIYLPSKDCPQCHSTKIGRKNSRINQIFYLLGRKNAKTAIIDYKGDVIEIVDSDHL